MTGLGGRSLALLLLLVACAPDSSQDRLPARYQRYGILRDLLLFHRRPDLGGPFFLDRFETTRGDWHSWLVARGLGPPVVPQPEDDSARVDRRHPIVGVSMTEARRFAAWRFCRLQRLDEWEHARTAGGRYPFPWGDRWRGGTWCNSRDLGLDRTTPVGSFPASGDGLGAYDLVGNVQEWTETVPLPPLYHSEDPTTNLPRPPVVLYMPGEIPARQSFGLAAWQPAWLPMPTVWMVEAAPAILPRLVVGGHYRSQVPLAPEQKGPFPTLGWWQDRDRDRPLPRLPDPMPNPVPLHPEEYDDLTGLRLATDPESLLVALLMEPAAPTAGEARLLRRFVLRAGHLQALLDAWPRARRRVSAAGPLLPLLRSELGR